MAAGCGSSNDKEPAAVGVAETDAPATSSPTTAEAPQPTTPAPNATVLWVIDGDTIEIEAGGQQATVRLIGIDTPEKTGGFRDAECYGDEATAAMESLLQAGDQVFLERDEEAIDRFDRVLAYVHHDGVFINHQLVLDGFAAAKRYPPNTFHAELLEAAQRDAREANRGLWAACGGPDQPLER